MDSQTLIDKAASIQNYKMVDQKYYIKNHKLGKGNFADTYLATLKDNEREIMACKLIAKQNLIDKLKNSKNPEQRKEYIINSLKKEVSVWKQVDHPSIVKFIDFSETSNNIYFFCQFCDGGDLEKKIKDKGRLPQIEAINLMKQIVDGCSYLYDKSIFHRDLKPENILIHQDKPKIADFGFAKFMDEDQKDRAAHNTAVGTPYYMSPQILSGENYSIKCDVWSLGIMFYQMLCGMLPWRDCNSIPKLLQTINSEPVTFPPSIQIDERLKAVIRGMLQVEEQNRLNIKEVQEALNQI